MHCSDNMHIAHRRIATLYCFAFILYTVSKLKHCDHNSNNNGNAFIYQIFRCAFYFFLQISFFILLTTFLCFFSVSLQRQDTFFYAAYMNSKPTHIDTL